MNDKIVKVIKTKVVEMTKPMSEYQDLFCGTVIARQKDGIEVLTGNGVLKILTVKPEGKGEMPAQDWINGVGGTKQL